MTGPEEIHEFLYVPGRVIMTDVQGYARMIYTDGRKLPADPQPSYLGYSVGHWEGDTLVVDVTSFNDKTWLIGAGTFHSEKLHITERYTRVNKDRIDYEATMVDPEVLTKPWVYKTTLMLRPGTRLREYTCVENNLDLDRYEHLVKDGVQFQRQ